MPSTLKLTLMWPATSVNNDGRTDFLRLSHLTALSAGVNYHLRCIHKGLMAFSRVTPPIRMHDQAILTRCFDPDVPTSDASGSLLPVVLNRWYDSTKKKYELVICNWRATAYTSLETLDFLFSSVRCRINISVFVNNMTNSYSLLAHR